MRQTLKALFVASFAVLAFLIMHQQAGAEAYISAEVPPFTNMYEGATYTVSVTAGSGIADYNSNTVGRVRIGEIGSAAEVVEGISIDYIAAGSSETTYATITVTTELMNACTNGTLPWYADSQFLAVTGGGFLWDFRSTSGTTPCSVGQPLIPVAVTPPEVTQYNCGIADDVVTLYPQPTGVLFQYDTDWMGGSRHITYIAAPGYVLTNQAEYVFADPVDNCMPDYTTVTSPTLIQQNCGPGNDDYLIHPAPNTTFVDPGWDGSRRTITYTADSGWEILGQSEFLLTDTGPACDIPVTIIAPVAMERICGDNNDEFFFNEPNGATYQLGAWSNNQRIVTYTASTGYEIIGPAQFTVDDTGEPCGPTPVTIAPPTLGNAICGADNDVFNLDMPEGVTGNWDGDWANNTRTATYVASDGYVISGNATVTATDDNDTCVTPVPPVLAWTVCGPENDNIEFQNQPTGIVEVPSTPWENGTYTVIYEPADGYAFPPDVSGIYEFQDVATSCIVVTEVPPVHTAICGPDNDEITVPPQPDGVTYQVFEDYPTAGVTTIEFDADFDHVWSDGAGQTYTIVDDTSECLTLIPPTTTAICGDDNDLVAIQDQINVNVTTDDVWENNLWAISFEAADGYMFVPDTITEYNLEDSGIPCILVTPNPPYRQTVCGSVDKIVVPQQPEGITFTEEQLAEGAITDIRFFVDSDYAFTEGAPTFYTFHTTVVSHCVDLDPPTVAEVCGPNNDVVIIPVQDPNVAVTSDGAWTDGKWNVSFQALNGYPFLPNTITEYNFVDADTSCVVQPITVTVSMPNDASAADAPWQLYAPQASQVAQPVFADGTVGTDNTFLLPELLPGTYRLVVTVPGFEVYDEPIIIAPDTTGLTVQITAMQVNPTEEPTQTAEPTATSTEEPTQTAEPTATSTEEPTETAKATETAAATEVGAVTILPETGSGSGLSLPLATIGVAASVLLAAWIGIDRRSRESR